MAINRSLLRAGLLAAALSNSASAQIRASVVSPAAGARLTGDAVTVAASLPAADLRRVRRVLFQYRPSGPGDWTDVPSSTAQPNPDAAAPFYAHWNVSGLAPGDYDLRAVASGSSGDDPAPPAVTVAVDHVSYSINERRAGVPVRREQAVTRAAALIDTGDASRPQFARFALPAGALDRSTATLVLISGPSGSVPLPTGMVYAGALDLSINDGQTCLCNGRSGALTVSYRDADGDGFVDGTAARVSRLRLYRYDGAAGAWKADFPSSVDQVQQTVAGSIVRLGRYAVVAPDGPAFAIRIFPIPFKPRGGNPDEGRAYAPADPDSGIVFENVPDGSGIEIFTESGARVKRLNVGSSGRLQWDAKNEQGQDVASGLYFAVFSLAGQPPQRRKLLVVR